MRFKRRTAMQIADMICGNYPPESTFLVYRSSSYLTEFFSDVETDYTHDGTTRHEMSANVRGETLVGGRQPEPNRAYAFAGWCNLLAGEAPSTASASATSGRTITDGERHLTLRQLSCRSVSNWRMTMQRTNSAGVRQVPTVAC
jgi:hypothetical protein